MFSSRKMFLLIVSFFCVAALLYNSPYVSGNSTGVVMNGNFKDWEGKYQNVRANSDAFRHVGIWADKENIYFYMDSAPDFRTNNQGGDNQLYLNTDFTITVGDEAYPVSSGHGFMDNQIMNFNNSSKSMSQVFDIKYWVWRQEYGYQPPTVGKAYAQHIVAGNRSNNIFEAQIPFSALGIKEIPENTKIAISNESIWRGNVSINYAGSPTGPWLLAGIGLVFAGGGYYLQNQRRKKITASATNEVIHA